MKTRYLLFLSFFALSACFTINNHHPFNAVPLQKMEMSYGAGFATANNIFTCGTYSPDSLNLDMQSSFEKLKGFALGNPICWRIGLGKGYSVALQHCTGSTPGMDRYEKNLFVSLRPQQEIKAYLSKSLALSDDLYLAISPAGMISRGVGFPAKSYRIKYFHKGFEIPVTLSYLWQDPFKTSDGYPQLVFSGTLRGTRDYFKGDMNSYVSEICLTTWYDDQPQNAVNRYGAMIHLDSKLTPDWAFSLQYGREYTRGRDYSSYTPIIYLGFEMKLWGRNKTGNHQR